MCHIADYKFKDSKDLAQPPIAVPDPHYSHRFNEMSTKNDST